ncbi:hypothetical protein V5O48_008023 [Marasmius crinis-equi]|uniref:Uncharacterized protein n=1 Tax=Marasmius crinis-equi TaxID=585013 RepID=A0ABR3FF19_9AGAR
MTPRKQPPSHRHATPSGPWPFLDVSDEVDCQQLLKPPPQPQVDVDDDADRSAEWKGYPQAQFANWTAHQQDKSGIAKVVKRKGSEQCRVYKVDVWADGTFHQEEDPEWVVKSNEEATVERFWDNLQQKSIPSRYQEQVQPGKGDPEPSIYSDYTGDSDSMRRLQASYLTENAIDISGPLKLRSTPGYQGTSANAMCSRLLGAGRSVYWSRIFQSTVPTGDPTFVALSLLWYAMYAWDEVLELLLTEVGWLESSTLSTLPHPDHPDRDPHASTHFLTHQLHVIRAHLLHYQNLLSDFRKSVMFLRKTTNPALNTPEQPPAAEQTPPPAGQRRPSVPRIATGDQVLRPLATVPESSSENTPITAPPSVVSAAHETSAQLSAGKSSSSSTPRSPWLLREQNEDRFIYEEALDLEMDLEEFEESEPQERMLKKESRILLNEIERLEMTSRMLDKRLGNVMQLAFSSVNIEDSKRMSSLAEAAGRDSAVMKQISYLTMVFLPATFIATVFGMNVQEINDGSIPHISSYLATAIPLTLVTIWIMMIMYYSTKQHSKKTPSTFIRLGPESIWRRGFRAMWRPVAVVMRSLSPLGVISGNASDSGGWRTASNTGTKSRLASAKNSVRTRASTLRQSVVGPRATNGDV